jgi:hypothetical protein
MTPDLDPRASDIPTGLQAIKARRVAVVPHYLVGRVLQIPCDWEAPMWRLLRHQQVEEAIAAYPSTSMFQWGPA